MKKIFFYIAFVFCFACSETKEKEISVTKTPILPVDVTGYWVNLSFIDHAKQDVLGSKDFYCCEMVFDDDSVLIDNGFEEYFLAYSIKDSVCILRQAFQDRDLYLKIHSDYTMSFIDTSLDYVHGNDVFMCPETLSSEEHSDININFISMLNDSLISGKYYLYIKGKPAKTEVEFFSDGKVIGLQGFSDYELCYSGDCMEMPDSAVNVILLAKDNGDADDYVWEGNRTQNYLRIYELEAPIADIKGQRKIKRLLFDLRR